MILFTSKHWMGALICASSLLLEACGGGAASTARGNSIQDFPGREALRSIASRPVGKVSGHRTADAADTWTIEAAPEVDKAQDTWTPTERWEILFEDVAKAAAPNTRLSKGMACLARELGRFYLANKTLPDKGLQRFMVGGCGNVVPSVGIEYFTVDLPPKMSDDRLFSEESSKNRASLAKSLSHKPGMAGFWFGRKDNQMVMFVASANEGAKLKPFSLTPDERGEVMFEGQALMPTQYFNAHINRGKSAVAACEIDMSIPKPNFRIVCPVDKDDETAWIQLVSVPPKRALGSVLLQALVRKKPTASPHYVAVRYGDPSPVTTPDDFAASVLKNLNGARKEAGLSELSFATAQSKMATSVAPHYFAALFGDKPEPETADTITLALIAGWDVQGMIRDAQLVWTTATTVDASRWLTSALEMPIGRETLLNPDIEQLALGPVLIPEERMLGAVTIGYRFHHGADHADDEKYLLSRVTQTRTRLSLLPPTRLDGADIILNEELLKVHQGTSAPRSAMDRVLQRSVEHFQRSMRGYIIETSSLEELQLPEEVLRQPTLQLDIGVTHFKPEAGAWARYAIIVLYAAAEDGAQPGKPSVVTEG
jgi:hypothetical protein